jgi:hypothetical protein
VLSLITEYHQPPKGYEYQTVQFKSNIVAVWLLCHRRFVYNHGAPTRTIYAFYNTKTKQFHAPINSKTVGQPVSLKDTTPYTSMPLNLNPLEYAFLHS